MLMGGAQDGGDDKRYRELETKPFYCLVIGKIIRIFCKSLLLRFLIKLVFKKLSMGAVLKEWVPVLRFAIGMAVHTAIF